MIIQDCTQILIALNRRREFTNWDELTAEPLDKVTALFNQVFNTEIEHIPLDWAAFLRGAHIVLAKKNDAQFQPLLASVRSLIRIINGRLIVVDRCDLILATLEEYPEGHLCVDDALENSTEIRELFFQLNPYITYSSRDPLELGIRLREAYRRIYMLDNRFKELLTILQNAIEYQYLGQSWYERLVVNLRSLKEVPKYPELAQLENTKKEHPKDLNYFLLEHAEGVLPGFRKELAKGEIDFKEAKVSLQEGRSKIEKFCSGTTGFFILSKIDQVQKFVNLELFVQTMMEEFFFPGELDVDQSVLVRNGAYKDELICEMLGKFDLVLCKTSLEPLDPSKWSLKLREYYWNKLRSGTWNLELLEAIKKCVNALRHRINFLQHFGFFLHALEFWPEIYLRPAVEDTAVIQDIFNYLFMRPGGSSIDYDAYNIHLRRCYLKLVRRQEARFNPLISLIKQFIHDLNPHASCLVRCEWVCNALEGAPPSQAWHTLMPETPTGATELLRKLAAALPGITIDREIWIPKLGRVCDHLEIRGEEFKPLYVCAHTCLSALDPNSILLEKCDIFLSAAGQWPDNKPWRQAFVIPIHEVASLFRGMVPLIDCIKYDRDRWIPRLKRLKWNLKFHDVEGGKALLQAIKECTDKLKCQETPA